MYTGGKRTGLVKFPAALPRLVPIESAAWAIACCLSWAVMYPVFGPVLALGGALLASLATGPYEEYAVIWIRTRSSDLRASWTWRQFLAPHNVVVHLVFILLLVSVDLLLCAALGAHWFYRPALVVLWVGSLASGGVVLRSEGAPPRQRIPELSMALWGLGGAIAVGSVAYFAQRAALPVAYGSRRYGPPQQDVTDWFSWTADQCYDSLFGPSFEASYWPLLAAAAGLVAGGISAGLAASASHAARSRNPFADSADDADQHAQVGAGAIFLSYSRSDSDTASSVVARLEDKVRAVWVDWQSINPSEQWRQSIADAIRTSDAFVVLISRNALRSVYCREECQQAIEQGKRVLPVVIDPALSSGCTAAMREAGWQDLTSYQRLDMTSSDDFAHAIRQILAFTRQEFRWVAGHTRLGIQTHEWWRSGLSSGFLLRRDELRAAQWLRANRPEDPDFHADLTERESALIDVSRRAVRRRTLTFRTGAVAVAVAMTTLSSLVVVAQTGTQTQHREAASRSLAAEALHTPGGNLSMAALLSAAAYREADTVQSRSAMATVLKQQNHLMKILPGTSGLSYSVVFSPDGSLLAVERTDRTVQLWRTVGWRLIGTLPGTLPANAENAFTADGTLLALVDGSRLTLTRTSTMRVTSSFATGFVPGALGWFGGVSSDGTTATASIAGAHSTLAWSVSDGRRATFDQDCVSLGRSDSVMWCLGAGGHNTLRHSTGTWTRTFPTASRLVGWAAGGEAVINTESGTAQVVPVGSSGTPWTPRPGMSAQALSPDGGRVLLVGKVAKEYAVWDLVSRRNLGPVIADALQGANRDVSGLSGDTAQAAAAEAPRTLGMDLITRKRGVLSTVDDDAEPDSPYLDRSGRMVAAVDTSRAVAVWDRGAPGHLVSEVAVQGPASGVWAVSPASDMAAVACVDQRLRQYDTGTGAPAGVSTLAGTASGVAYSPDGERVAVVETDSSQHYFLEVFASATGRRIARLSSANIQLPKEYPIGVLFSPDGRRVYLGLHESGSVTEWDVAGQHIVRTYGNLMESGFVQSVLLSPDGRFLNVVGVDGRLRQWDSATGRQTWSTDNVGPATAYSRDGSTLLTTSVSGETLREWNAVTHRSTQLGIDVNFPVRAMAISSVADIALLTDADNVVHLWDLRHRGEILRAVTSTTMPPALGPGGTRAVSLHDGTAFVTISLVPDHWYTALCGQSDLRLAPADWAVVAPKQRFIRVC
ncbi:toll/interleukin-1 receptor domain-containing protein [Streptomyces sp. SPB162]|uniref:toll/interleukin-1 receptor domain-containing protein n=1 Tax=Streptomyces sp. SPB162 TaxID=2940560 RepID=UPI002405CD60|nr:toll/interleukin-1 receptor domain-containing protein [Streptomyces sp. SPB162]MDF9817237.1 WD40 repeat protein [Streptomyces sp. SPB162]